MKTKKWKLRIADVNNYACLCSCVRAREKLYYSQGYMNVHIDVKMNVRMNAYANMYLYLLVDKQSVL